MLAELAEAQQFRAGEAVALVRVKLTGGESSWL
jgi:hypothetical protein